MRNPESIWHPVAAGLSVSVIFVAVLSIPLTTAADLGLDRAETMSWLIAVYGVAGVLSLVLTAWYRQPLLLTGNIFILLFIDRLGVNLAWSELVGAAVVAGVVVLAFGPLGLTEALTRWIPAPIVFGLLAGLVLDFFVRMFDVLEQAPLLVGGTVATYLVARRVTEPRIPAILPALVTSVVLAATTGNLHAGAITLTMPTLTLTTPDFSAAAVLTATPVMVLLITVQANVPSIVYLRSNDFVPPDRAIGVVSGLGTALGSVLGPTGISLSLPATALCAGPGAGDQSTRYRSVYLAAGVSVLIAILAAVASQVTSIVPLALLVTLVGLAVVEILIRALHTVTAGPLVLGPVFAFGVASSDLSLLGLDALFWALVGGLVISRLVEPDAWKEATAPSPAPD